MPITLEEAKAGMANKIDRAVIDEFRRASMLLDKLTFDDAVSPGTGGSSMVYGYMRLKTPSTASTRRINNEYAPNEANREVANVTQPADRGIMLKDIIENAVPWQGKSYCLTANYASAALKNTLERHQRTMVAEPVRIGDIGSNSQGHRVYSSDGKSVTLSANGGGQGGGTGLYAIPAMRVVEGTKQGYADIMPGECVDLAYANSKLRRGRAMREKSNCLTTSCEFYQYCGTADKPIFKVENGSVEIGGTPYPIKIKDGCYIIRKLSPVECERLQTLPDNYTEGVSNTQRYRQLGNGWTVDVISHILGGLT